MPRKAIATDKAPKAIGPYSQAVEAPAGRILFLSGQIPIDPASGDLVHGDMAVQARRTMDNLGAVLAAAGMGYEDVMRTTIYLVDLGDFSKVNDVYGSYFGAPPPARATVQVAGLPKGARMEIDAFAVAAK